MPVDTTNGHPAMDYPEHLKTYHGFLRGAVVLICVCAVILTGMLLTLT